MKKKKQAGRSARKKLSCDGSVNYLNLKKQVDEVNNKMTESVRRMAHNPDVSVADYIKGINKAAKAFQIMNDAIRLGVEMEKLKEGK